MTIVGLWALQMVLLFYIPEGQLRHKCLDDQIIYLDVFNGLLKDTFIGYEKHIVKAPRTEIPSGESMAWAIRISS